MNCAPLTASAMLRMYLYLAFWLLTILFVTDARKRVEYDPQEEKDIPVKIKLLGDMATPHPDSGIELDFVPKQVYYQVRRYDENKRLPQSEALKEASTPEEVINAPRLREVLTHKKTQEVYEEQGYEDAGYDHRGSAKHKVENEKLLEDDVVEFGKDSAPSHPNEEPEELQEDEEQPSEYESESNSDTLDPMDSELRQRKIKHDHVEEENYANEDGKNRKDRKSNDHAKQSHSLHTSEKQPRKYSNRDINRRSDKQRTKPVKNRSRESLENSSPNKKIRKSPTINKENRRADYERQNDKNRDKSFTFDVEKYPFYNKLNLDKYTKHSALKYALNPRYVPVKVSDKMSFYDSRKLQCDEITGPQVETPNGEERNSDNSELKNPKRGKPRMGKLGESIDCLKRKYFGHDPLDNPFFKESDDF